MTSDTTRKYHKGQRMKRRLRDFITIVALFGKAILMRVMVAYTFAGAVLFQSLELQNEQESKKELIDSKKELIDSLWSKTSTSADPLKLEGKVHENLHYGNWTKMVDKLLAYYAEDLVAAQSAGLDVTDVIENEMECQERWTLAESLFFAGTVYTTIGYGNFAPVTPEGKVAVIIYGSIGIPLCLILLAHLGHAIAKWIKVFVMDAKTQIYGPRRGLDHLEELWPPQDEIESLSGVSSLIVLLGLSLVYLLSGAYMYQLWEDDWDTLDAIYFIFVSTSTIGLGDVLPNNPKWFMMTSLYIFVGLSLISTGFTILQDMMEQFSWERLTKAPIRLCKTSVTQTDSAFCQFISREDTESAKLESWKEWLNSILGITMKTVVTSPEVSQPNNNQMEKTAETRVINSTDGVITVEATITLD